MVQISCRPSDVATSSGLLDRSRPWDSRSTESCSAALERTSAAALCEQHDPTRSINGGDHTFEKRSNVRFISNFSRRAGAISHRRTARSMNAQVWQERMLRAIEWYQGAFQWRPSPCRFSPTCSHYSHEAISVHGPKKGLWLTIRRLLRCRPFGPSGFDPVPDAVSSPSVDHELMRTP